MTATMMVTLNIIIITAVVTFANSIPCDRTVLLVIIPMLVSVALAGSTGMVVTAYYAAARCDPLASKQLKNSNQVRNALYIFTLIYTGKSINQSK